MMGVWIFSRVDNELEGDFQKDFWEDWKNHHIWNKNHGLWFLGKSQVFRFFLHTINKQKNTILICFKSMLWKAYLNIIFQHTKPHYLFLTVFLTISSHTSARTFLRMLITIPPFEWEYRLKTENVIHSLDPLFFDELTDLSTTVFIFIKLKVWIQSQILPPPIPPPPPLIRRSDHRAWLRRNNCEPVSRLKLQPRNSFQLSPCGCNFNSIPSFDYEVTKSVFTRWFSWKVGLLYSLFSSLLLCDVWLAVCEYNDE